MRRYRVHGRRKCIIYVYHERTPREIMLAPRRHPKGTRERRSVVRETWRRPAGNSKGSGTFVGNENAPLPSVTREQR